MAIGLASRTKQIVYGGLIAAVTAVVVYHVVGGARGPLAEMPDTPESAQVFICSACGKVFTLTPRERAKLMASSPATQAEDGSRGRSLRLPCPACGKTAAAVAASCPVCGRPYLRVGNDGQLHSRCPPCEAGRGKSDKP